MTAEENEIAIRNNQVDLFLQSEDKASALSICLQNPPVNAKSEEIKVNCFIFLKSSLS
jgi:hypothetical protein